MGGGQGSESLRSLRPRLPLSVPSSWPDRLSHVRWAGVSSWALQEGLPEGGHSPDGWYVPQNPSRGTPGAGPEGPTLCAKRWAVGSALIWTLWAGRPEPYCCFFYSSDRPAARGTCLPVHSRPHAVSECGVLLPRARAARNQGSKPGSELSLQGALKGTVVAVTLGNSQRAVAFERGSLSRGKPAPFC